MLNSIEKLIKAASLIDSKQNEIDNACHRMQNIIHGLNEKLELTKSIINNISRRSNHEISNIMKTIQDTLSMRCYTLSQQSKELLKKGGARIKEIENRKKMLDYRPEPTPDQTNEGLREEEKASLMVTVEKQDYSTEQIEKVMKSLIEVSEMFQTMGEMVALQQSLIERIDEDTESALDFTEKGKAQLLIAYDHVVNTRALMLKLFAIVFIFCLFYILFVA